MSSSLSGTDIVSNFDLIFRFNLFIIFSGAITKTFLVLDTISFRLAISLWTVSTLFEINKTTGKSLSKSAMGPCLISDDKAPSACMYAISFIFKAASLAIGKL